MHLTVLVITALNLAPFHSWQIYDFLKLQFNSFAVYYFLQFGNLI